MTWRQFATALPLLARTRGCAADECLALVAACPGPQLNSESGGTGRQSSFTGRSGSLNGSRPASVTGASEEEWQAGGGDGGGGGGEGGADDEVCCSPSGSGGRRSVGGFTPLRRPSVDGAGQHGQRASGGGSPCQL